MTAWRLDVRPRAQRRLPHLPEKIATVAAEFIVGALLDNPHRVSHPLHDECAGQHSARRYRIEEQAHMVVVLDVSLGAPITVHRQMGLLTAASCRRRGASA